MYFKMRTSKSTSLPVKQRATRSIRQLNIQARACAAGNGGQAIRQIIQDCRENLRGEYEEVGR